MRIGTLTGALFILAFVFSAVYFAGCSCTEEGEQKETPSDTEKDGVVDDDIIKKGKQIFQEKACVACHTIGGGKRTGPDLLGVTTRREEVWLRKWLKSPDTMIYSDPVAKDLLGEYLVVMPNQGLTDEEIDILIKYFRYEDSVYEKK